VTSDQDSGLGGLYDFLPPPDPEKDEAAKVAAEKNKTTRPALPPEDKTRVIFLDVDGVLLPTGTVEVITIDGVTMPKRDVIKESDFSVTALGSLRSIVQETGATIVLSSEWRRTEVMRNAFGIALRSNGLPQIRSFTTTAFKQRPEILKAHVTIAFAERRAREIGEWLKRNPDVKTWVAIDDVDLSWGDGVRARGTPLMKSRVVKTHPEKCLSAQDAQSAIDLLCNPPVFTPEEEAQVREENRWCEDA